MNNRKHYLNESVPLVTIGIPIYNGSKYIWETLQSISKQTYSNLEVIIVDDCSSDNSDEIYNSWARICQFPLIIKRNARNIGVTQTCNILLQLANGKYFQLFGQDDIMLPNKIQDDVLLFEKQQDDVAVVYSNVNLIDEAGRHFGNGYFERISYQGEVVADLFIELVKRNFIPAPAVLMRTKLVKGTGGYDESLQFEDWDMWLKLAKDYKFVSQNKMNVNYRIHQNSIMANKDIEKTIIRNRANLSMFNKYLGLNTTYDAALYKKLNELCIYSYFVGDADSAEILKEYLKKRFNVKLWVYSKFALLGIKHWSNWFKTNKTKKKNAN
jgi:glycosyltransferase involved in cell wall biosynthesis